MDAVAPEAPMTGASTKPSRSRFVMSSPEAKAMGDVRVVGVAAKDCPKTTAAMPAVAVATSRTTTVVRTLWAPSQPNTPSLGAGRMAGLGRRVAGRVWTIALGMGLANGAAAFVDAIAGVWTTLGRTMPGPGLTILAVARVNRSVRRASAAGIAMRQGSP